MHCLTCFQMVMKLWIRVRLTNGKSYSEEYAAYDIMTYKFFHNSDDLFRTITDNNYTVDYTNLYEDVFDLELIRD